MIDRLIVLDQKKKTAEARLNTLLNRPTQMPFADLGQIQQSHFSLPFEDLQKIAEDNRPVLYGLRHLIDRFKFAARLAEKEYYPDFDVGVSYGQRDDSPTIERADFISAFVTVNIPLWYKTKQSRKVSEEQANIRRVQEQYNSMRNNVFFQIKDLLAEIEKSGEEIKLFGTGLIPQSRASLESALAGYEVNKVDFLTLVNNEITLYNYEIDYYRAMTNFENKLAELEAAVGKRLF
jgi:outer membrane protein TolC